MFNEQPELRACGDTDLLEMIQTNDQHAFNLLYKKYWQPLLHFAGQFLDDTDTCEEIVQDLFVHLHVRSSPIKIRSSVSSYLYTAMRNRIFNHVRNRALYKKHVQMAVSAEAGMHNNVEQFMNLTELRGEIARSLNRMPAKYREVYLLYDEHHYTVKKIAAILNRPVDTVEKQLRKALSLLRNHLKVARMHA
jgi:RNA polymerase sigma-70 factor (ECF subfamily)